MIRNACLARMHARVVLFINDARFVVDTHSVIVFLACFLNSQAVAAIGLKTHSCLVPPPIVSCMFRGKTWVDISTFCVCVNVPLSCPRTRRRRLRCTLAAAAVAVAVGVGVDENM